MDLTTDRGFVYAPLYQTYASRLDDEMPEPPWTDAIGWSTALRQATELLDPDVIVLTGADGLIADLQRGPAGSLQAPRFDDGLGAGVEEVTETVRILDDVRPEPVFCELPGPVMLCVERLGDEWLQSIETDELAALDALHAASQVLTDVVRALEGTVMGLVVHEPVVDRAIAAELSLADVMLESGALFNVAEHHDLTVVGRYPGSITDSVSLVADEFDRLVVEELPAEMLEELTESGVCLGGAFPADVWTRDTETFESQVRAYLEGLPEGFVLMPDIPPATPPERIREFRTMLDER